MDNKFVEFLKHLESCGGCLGEKRTFRKCKYAIECAVAEVLLKKGVVRNSKDLLEFVGCNINDNTHTEECTSTRAFLYGIGPCSTD